MWPQVARSTLLTLLLGIFVTAAGAQEKWVRKPAVAGQFYPADPEKLQKEINRYLDQAKLAHISGEIIALICPHAGYMYSGWVAAHSYRQISGRRYDTVIIIAPSHVEPFAFSSVYPQGAYETPLGRIPVDVNLAREIAGSSPSVKLSKKGHRQEHLFRQEHALEVQLPFLQSVLSNFKIVPIVMGEQSLENCRELAEAIVGAIKKQKSKKVLLVASSDLSHYHPYERAVEIDSRFIRYVERYDYLGLYKASRAREVEACGLGPVITALIAAKKLGADKTKVLFYANSGDVTGDKSGVVGYLSAVIYRFKEGPKSEKVGVKLGLTPSEKRELLRIAKETIRCCVRGEPKPSFEVSSPRLKEKRGAFVTIYKHGVLRGCIGYILPVMPLYQAVAEAAQAAALRDPRFPPVKPKELNYLKIEISVLTVPRPITDIRKIQVGKHGLIIRKGPYQGLLLPQVAVDHNWDRKTFLEQTCLKAGLPPDAWKEKDTLIQVFSAEVFGEE